MKVAELLRNLEEQLVDPSVRRDKGRLLELLAADFREFGSSGRIYSRADIIEALSVEAPSDISIEDFKTRQIASEVVLATYRAVKQTPNSHTIASLRSSLWVFREGRWQMGFHQGTVVSSPDDAAEGSQ